MTGRIPKSVAAVLTCVFIVANPRAAAAQDAVMSFRTSYSDFRFNDVAKSFVTSGGNLVQVVQDKFAGTGGLGGDFSAVSKSGRWLFNFGAEYKSTSLFGSGGFKIMFSPDDTPNFDTTKTVKVHDATAYFRSLMGFGVNVLPWRRVFLFINPNVDIQYGQRVFLEDAYSAFVKKGYNDPGDFKVENGLLAGGALRTHAGIWLTDDTGIDFTPGYVFSKRFSESYQGTTYNGMTASPATWGYEFSFALIKRVH